MTVAGAHVYSRWTSAQSRARFPNRAFTTLCHWNALRENADREANIGLSAPCAMSLFIRSRK